MNPFAYERADETARAVAAVAGSHGQATFLGGGTNLVDLMKLGVATPERLVDVTRLPHTQIQETRHGGVLIGAAVRNSELATHPLVRERYPLLSEAILAGASGQIRNMATIGGNLLQRTRCPYFQDVSKPCNKREPGSGCPALHGEHRELAIIGHSEHCVATHPSDMAVALAALGAEVHLHGSQGLWSIPLNDFYRLPGDEPQRDTIRAPEDLITHIELPPLPLARNSSYRKVRDRASFAFALVSVAAAIEVKDGDVADCRIAYGGIAHKPWRARKAEDALRGGPATPEAFAAAADAELSDAAPLRDNGFKLLLARNLLVRVLSDLAEA